MSRVNQSGGHMAALILWTAVFAAAFGVVQFFSGNPKIGILIGIPGIVFLWWMWSSIRRQREQLEWEVEKDRLLDEAKRDQEQRRRDLR